MKRVGECRKKYRLEALQITEKVLLLSPDKSYTTSSLQTPPGLDRSKGSRS